MFTLPPIAHTTKSRPNRPLYEKPYHIPDEKYQDFWADIYNFLFAIDMPLPVRDKELDTCINEAYGYFGYRVHPVTKEAKYFHAGLSFDLSHEDAVYPLRDGILEYAGYGAANGHYILISHPDIVTEDGYVFHTMYCHLKKPLVSFSSYQKMLREISLASYPIIPVTTETKLGTASVSGLSRDNHPGLYLQCSFRKMDTPPIVIDPYRMYTNEIKENTTRDIISAKDIEKIYTN
ncbi:hypothetical protein CL684_02155 [Candidatus Campbellbacteria bacterium]|nr:hypothetical protein [Candidatus Campbellbacteria bacterium]|tara:strand:- start:1149 stop:1850 length:702 start_codon:yes stop_codon:yes gene_type:complete